jgi:hypothetical protein
MILKLLLEDNDLVCRDFVNNILWQTIDYILDKILK